MHDELGECWLYCDGAPELLFTENESNAQRLWRQPNPSPYVKDAFHEYVIAGRSEAVTPAKTGTKAAAHYRIEVPAGGSQAIRLRLSAGGGGADSEAVPLPAIAAGAKEAHQGIPGGLFACGGSLENHIAIIDDSDVFSIIVDHSNPATIYLSACSGIYKSENGGVSFHKIQGIPSSARRTRMPLFGALTSNAHDGAPIVIARDYYDGGRQAGLMAARIMRGGR